MSNSTLSYKHLINYGLQTACVLHDISSPLTSALYSSQLPESANSHEILSKKLADIQTALRQIVKIIRHNSQPPPQKTNINAQTAIDLAIKPLQKLAKRKRIDLEIAVQKNLSLFGNQDRFIQIIYNLTKNSIEASSANQTVAITALVKNHQFILIIQDWGEGIDPELINQIFEMHFTTKYSGENLGLGLVIVKAAVELDFNGRLEISSQLGEGTKAEITLPWSTSPGPS